MEKSSSVRESSIFLPLPGSRMEHENALNSFCRRSRLPEQRRFANCCVQEPSCYFCSTLDSRAFPSGWSAKSGLRQRWLAAQRVHLRSPPMPATAETWLLLRHPRAPATSAGLVQEVRLQIRVASVGILFSGTLRYGRQSLAALRKSLKKTSRHPTFIRNGTSAR